MISGGSGQLVAFASTNPAAATPIISNWRDAGLSPELLATELVGEWRLN
jgi:hypothetical protein